MLETAGLETQAGAFRLGRIDLAVEAGLTLVGFSRGESFNVYAGAHRVTG